MNGILKNLFNVGEENGGEVIKFILIFKNSYDGGVLEVL